MQTDDEALRRAAKIVYDNSFCRLCDKLLSQPVILTCGHSPWCRQCFIVAPKPQVKTCPTCETPVAGRVRKNVAVNKTLNSALFTLFPAAYKEPRPDIASEVGATSTAAMSDVDVLVGTDLMRLRLATEKCCDLRADYFDKAAAMIRQDRDPVNKKTHLVIWCSCDLVCLPKHSKKGRWFFGCPRWQPGDASQHCKRFAWLSEKQQELMKL